MSCRECDAGRMQASKQTLGFYCPVHGVITVPVVAQAQLDAVTAQRDELLTACIAARNLLAIANAGLILHGRPFNQSAQEKIDMLNAAIAKATGTEAAS